MNCIVAADDLALNRPAWQSSTVNWILPVPASLSVDGNADPIFTHGSCSNTELEWNPWWVVDIGYERTRITGVNLTNIDDSAC